MPPIYGMKCKRTECIHSQLEYRSCRELVNHLYATHFSKSVDAWPEAFEIHEKLKAGTDNVVKEIKIEKERPKFVVPLEESERTPFDQLKGAYVVEKSVKKQEKKVIEMLHSLEKSELPIIPPGKYDIKHLEIKKPIKKPVPQPEILIHGNNHDFSFKKHGVLKLKTDKIFCKHEPKVKKINIKKLISSLKSEIHLIESILKVKREAYIYLRRLEK